MALIADIDSIDLVVEPSELTEAEAQEIGQAIRERRDAKTSRELTNAALALLARRRAEAVKTEVRAP